MKGALSIQTLCWSARILSILSIGTVLLFAFGEGFNPFHFSSRELILSLFFPLGVCLGMALAWRWEGIGGFITLVSLLLFYLVNRILSPRFPGPALVVFAAPGFLFLLYWLMTSNVKNIRRSE